MFGTIRRHQNWLWAVIITVIILSFVVFFAPDVKFGGRMRALSTEFGSIDNKPIQIDEYRAANVEARLNYFMRSGGQWPGGEENIQENLKRDTIFRVLLLRKLKEMDISVSDEAVSRLAKERLGENVVQNLRAFEKEYLQPGGVHLEDLEAYLRHEAGIQQMVQVASAGARLVNPREAETMFRKDNEKLATEAALFSASNFLDRVTVIPEAVTNHYTRQQAQYRVPERIQVAYIEFPASNFLAEAEQQFTQRTNINAILDEEYMRRGADSFKDNGTNMPAEQAKAKIKEEVRHSFALREAHRKASEFGNDLYSQEVTKEADFEKLAAAKGIEVKTTEPFDRMKGLEDTAFPPAFRQKALSLTDAQPVSFSPIPGTNAVYVIALKNKIPSELPPLEKVREKVASDYKYSQALNLARQEGRNFHTALTNALNNKETFTKVAADAKVQTIPVPPFSPSAAPTNADPRINVRMLANVSESLKPGEASQFIPTADGGLVVYLKERIPVSEQEIKEELPEFAGRLRLYRQNEAFNQWFRKQAEVAKLVVPQREQVSPPGQPRPQAAPPVQTKGAPQASVPSQPKAQGATPPPAQPKAASPAPAPTAPASTPAPAPAAQK